MARAQVLRSKCLVLCDLLLSLSNKSHSLQINITHRVFTTPQLLFGVTLTRRPVIRFGANRKRTRVGCDLSNDRLIAYYSNYSVLLFLQTYELQTACATDEPTDTQRGDTRQDSRQYSREVGTRRCVRLEYHARTE